MREYLHTLYQFTDRWVVDDTKFRAAFGDHATPLDDAARHHPRSGTATRREPTDARPPATARSTPPTTDRRKDTP